MASIIDKIDLYLLKLSASEKEKFLQGLFSKYVSRDYLSNYLPFDYYGFAISSTTLRTIAFQYVILHPESKELKEQYRLAKIEEAIVHKKIDVPKFKKQYERFIAGEELTTAEKAQASRYAKQYASEEEKEKYQKAKDAPKKFKTHASIAYSKYCECGYSDEFFELASKLNVSKADLAILPLQYIYTELTGKEQEVALQKNLHTIRNFIDKIQQVEHSQKVEEARILVEGVLAIDAYDVSSLCKQLSISRKTLENAVSFLSKEDSPEVEELLAKVSEKYSFDHILLPAAIQKIANLTKYDSENKKNDYCYRLLEYALYIGCHKDCPPYNVISQATKILSGEELLSFRKLVRSYIDYSRINNLCSSDMIFQEKRFHQEEDGKLVDSIYQLDVEQKKSILAFFERHGIPFDYTIYSVAEKRLMDGSFDPNGDLVKGGTIFPNNSATQKK